MFDTLASVLSGVSENDVMMDKAVGMIADIAKAGFIAGDIMHHSTKAQDGKETTTSYRGSTSIAGKVREHSTIVYVPKDEWAGFGWSDAEGARTIRIMGQKANDKPHAGTWCFRREFPNVVAYDVRNPSDPKSATIGILVPLGKPTANRAPPQAALRALYAFQQAGGQDHARSHERIGGPAPRTPNSHRRRLGRPEGSREAHRRTHQGEAVDAATGMDGQPQCDISDPK